MGYYDSGGYWQEEWQGQDPPPGGAWYRPDLASQAYAPGAAGVGSPASVGYANNLPADYEPVLPMQVGPTVALPTPSGASATSTGGSTSAAGGSGVPLNASGNAPDDVGWALRYLAEHGGKAPYSWKQQEEIRDASQIWAGSHGSSQSWGNKPGDDRVPNEIFQRISSARRSPDIGPQGAEAWASAADDIGGAIMAARGQRYHPLSATGEDTDTKEGLLSWIVGALRR